jgi:hypothetical protein
MPLMLLGLVGAVAFESVHVSEVAGSQGVVELPELELLELGLAPEVL